jgi:hypothetical protein
MGAGAANAVAPTADPVSTPTIARVTAIIWIPIFFLLSLTKFFLNLSS